MAQTTIDMALFEKLDADCQRIIVDLAVQATVEAEKRKLFEPVLQGIKDHFHNLHKFCKLVTDKEIDYLWNAAEGAWVRFLVNRPGANFERELHTMRTVLWWEPPYEAPQHWMPLQGSSLESLFCMCEQHRYDRLQSRLCHP